MSEKSILLLNRTAPYGSHAARESLDIALTCGAFEFPVSLLFMDDGVFQLLGDHKPQSIGSKNLSASLAALAMYDVDQLFVCQASLAERGLSEADLALPATCVAAADIQSLIAKHTSVLSF